MNTPVRVVFFGSTTDSVIVLDAIHSYANPQCPLLLVGVVTQSPKPVGRDKVLTPTPVATWAESHGISLLTFPPNTEKPWLFADEETVINALESCKADIMISASFGIKIPWTSISGSKHGGLNVHPSILPHWRGADPVPWAIISGDHQIGVTVVTLSETFDNGGIVAQEKIPIREDDTSDPLRTKLFGIGATLLLEALPKYLDGSIKPKSYTTVRPDGTKLPYARKLTRDDGFVPFESLMRAFSDKAAATTIDKKFRALMPWPGIWTTVPIKSANGEEPKRLKIIAEHLKGDFLTLDTVQLEGKKPVPWDQFCSAYGISVTPS
jgi:methionyl-tRNA formyltransferase